MQTYITLLSQSLADIVLYVLLSTNRMLGTTPTIHKSNSQYTTMLESCVYWKCKSLKKCFYKKPKKQNKTKQNIFYS